MVLWLMNLGFAAGGAPATTPFYYQRFILGW